MNPFDYSKAVTDFWTAQGQALMKAQEQAGAALAQGMTAMTSGKIPMLPSMPTDLSAGAADLANAGKSMMELWSAVTSAAGKIAAFLPKTADADSVVEATFRKIADPRSWMGGTGEMDDVLGRMAEGPRFADLWEAERRYSGVLQAWMNLRRRGLEHNTVVLQAWLQAARRFTEQLAGRDADAKPLDAKAALGLWTETANQQLLETQRSDPFLQSQAAMIRATTDLRLAQQELVEHFGKQYGFPTRTELDDVHRSVTELRRELRAMRRQQNAPPAPQAKTPPEPQAKSASERQAKTSPAPQAKTAPAPQAKTPRTTPPARRPATRKRGAAT
jgi:polyhydroxyalkanoate synthase subunit PhaE